MIGSEKYHDATIAGRNVQAASACPDAVSDSQLRVLLVLPYYINSRQGGSEIRRLEALIRRSGGSSCVISFEDLDDSAVRGESRTDVGRGYGLWWEFLHSLSRQMANYSVVHLFYSSQVSFFRWIVPIVLMAKFFGKKVVLDYNSLTDFDGLHDRMFLYQKFLRLCDRVLVFSDYQLRLAHRMNIRATYFGAAIDARRISPRVISSLQPSILMMGELERVANAGCALRAFRLVKQKYPRAEIIIAGGGAVLPALKQEVEAMRLNGITFTGEVTIDRMSTLLAQADLFVNCSAIDSASSSMLLAMAHGLPVITTSLGRSSARLKNEEQVLYTTYNDHLQLADRVIQLIETPELVEKLSKNAPAAVSAYDWRKVSRDWMQMYRRLSA